MMAALAIYLILRSSTLAMKHFSETPQTEGGIPATDLQRLTFCVSRGLHRNLCNTGHWRFCGAPHLFGQVRGGYLFYEAPPWRVCRTTGSIRCWYIPHRERWRMEVVQKNSPRQGDGDSIRGSLPKLRAPFSPP